MPDGISWPAPLTPENAVVHARNRIEIAAPADVIWSLLTDCTAWPSWYSHCSDVSIRSGGSRLDAVGARFRFRTLGLFFEPTVVTFESERALVWSAKGPLGTSGAHAWLIEPSPSGFRVVTEEIQRGAALRLLRARLTRDLERAHEDWLVSLKREAETTGPTSA